MSHHDEQRIEVLFERSAGIYHPGQIVAFKESDPFLTAVLKGKFAAVVNPPTWELDTPSTKEEVVQQSAVIKSVIKRDTQKKQEQLIEDKPEEVEEASNESGDSNDDSSNEHELGSGSGSL